MTKSYTIWSFRPTTSVYPYMGVSAQQHRVCTGLYNVVCSVVRGKIGESQSSSCSFFGIFVGFVIFFYIVTYIMFMNLACAISPLTPSVMYTPSIKPLPSLLTHLNLWSLVINFTEINRCIKSMGDMGDDTSLFNICKYLFCKAFNRPLCGLNIFQKFLSIALDGLSLFLFLLNITLIVMCNPSMLNPGPDSFSVFYNNIQGFINTRDLASELPPLNMTKVHEIHGFIFSNQPDVLIFNETWLKKSILDNEILPDNYKVFRIDRSAKSHPWDPDQPKKFRKNGGGVLIAHRTDLNISSVKFTKLKVKAELLSVIFKTTTGKKICISTFYRVGTLGLENFQEFERHFKTLASNKKLNRHILIGDFNFHEVSWPDGHTSCELQHKFLDFLTSDLGHTQLISNPTHKSGNTLDLIFTNIPALIKNVKILDQNELCLSDHFGVKFNVDMKVKFKDSPKTKSYNYRKANWVRLNNSLRQVNWRAVLDSSDPHTAWPRFKAILSNLCDSCIPKKTIKSRFQPPWFDSRADKIRDKKELWRKRAKDATNETERKACDEKFRSFRREFKKTMNENLRLNVEDESDPALISKKFWSHVKSKSKSTRIPETVRHGDRFRSNLADQANLFNNYFYEQFSEESNYDIDIDYTTDQFYDLRFNSHDVFLILRSINPSKAAGPDGIHGTVLKNCASSLALPISILFNVSFSTGCIPAEWKAALVVPVHKKGDKGSVENYRPISLTSLVMKVFERCIKTALYLACVDKLDTRQHGFVNDKSCTTQMVPFTDDLALALNNRSRMDIIYFDFAKAFDSVSHDIILHKLKNQYNVDGLMLKFIRSYLKDRTQKVVVGGFTSSFLPIKSGVPQGSILGPLLFVLFINDMFSCVSEGTNIALYADDTKIWREILSYNDHIILQNDIDNLFNWSIINKMVFHPHKCKVLSVTRQRNILDNLPFNIYFYSLSRTIIDYVDSQTDLGVEITPRLLWKSHCDKLASKASSKLGLLKRTCHFTVNRRQKRSFYLAIVRSIFEHCSVIWAPQHQYLIEKFSVIQKRAVKWIFGEQFASYSDEVLVEKQRELNILPIKLKFILNDLVMFYKIVNELVPISLPSYISVCEPDDVRYTRRNATIQNLSDRSTYVSSVTPNCDVFKHSFFYRTLHKWNKLPVSVREAFPLSKMKSALSEFLWTADTDWPD